MERKKIYMIVGFVILVALGLFVFLNMKQGAIVQANDGYVVYLPMNDLKDTVSGLSASQGTATLVSNGAIGSAYSFDGVGGSLLTFPSPTNVTEISKFKFINSMSVEVWVKPTKLSHGVVIAKTDSFILQLFPRVNSVTNVTTYQYQGAIYYNNNGSRAYSNELAVSREITSADLNKWMHLVFTYSNVGGAKLYVNGVLSTSIPSSVSPMPAGSSMFTGDSQLTIGNRIDWTSSFNRPFNGLIDEVKLYSKVLTATEVSQHYNGCTIGQTRCSANNGAIETCVADTAIGGNKWSTMTTCLTGQACSGTTPTCTSTQICTAGARRCSSGVAQTCSIDGLTWANTPCTTAQTCTGAGICQNTCIAQTCSSLGKNCGNISNGCGNILNCGTCGIGMTCTNNICVVPETCTLHTQCNDGNACTIDTCTNGICDYQTDEDCILPTCKPYEEFSIPLALVDTSMGECKLSINKLFTSEGIKSYYNDKIIGFWVFLGVVIVTLVIFGWRISKKRR